MGGVLGLIAGAGQAIAQAEYNSLAMQQQHYYNLESMRASNAEQYRYGEKAANNADKRQRKMYEDYLSYMAQVRQMKEAGLNPALMYSGGGASGAGSIPHGTQGGGAGASANGVQALGLQNMEMASIAANTELIKSQTNKNNADADNIRGKEGTKGYYEVRKIIEETKGQAISNIMADIDANWRNIKNMAEVNKMQSDIDAAFNNYQLELQKVMLEYESFEQKKEEFAIEHKFQEHKLKSEEKRFYDGLDAAESKFVREIEHAIEMQTRQMKFENEQQERKFKHEMKIAVMKTAGSIIGGGLGGVLLKAIK